MAMTARWLSLSRTPSESDARWLAPPPARTAAFWSARRPGSVFRVSTTRVDGLAAPTASTTRRVAVATPDRWHRKLRAVRSAVRIDASGPRTSPTTDPASTAVPSGACQSTSTAGSTWRKVSSTQSRPARTPGSRATTVVTAARDGSRREAVRSPSASTSSPRARATAWRTARSGGSTLGPGTRLAGRRGDARPCGRDQVGRGHRHRLGHGDVQELVGPVRVAPRTEHPGGDQGYAGVALGEHGEEGDRAALPERARRAAEEVRRCTGEGLGYPVLERRSGPACGRGVEVDLDPC